jgi:hypothetical protein
MLIKGGSARDVRHEGTKHAERVCGWVGGWVREREREAERERGRERERESERERMQA